MRHTRFLAWTLLVPVMALAAHSVAAERIDDSCTDSDADGFYFEADCGTAPDCNDASPTIYPGAVEACDGFDNDCNGQLDDSVACERMCDSPEASERVQATLTDDRSVLNWTALVWTGNGYGLAWVDRRSSRTYLYFVRLDANGHRVGTETLVAGGSASSPNLIDLVWTGSEFALVWKDRRDGDDGIYFVRLDGSGNKIGTERRLSATGTNSSSPELAWNGNGYGVIWQGGGAWTGTEVQFLRVDAAGQPLGEIVVVSPVDGNSSSGASIGWTGSEYGIFWNDARTPSGIYLARLDAAGVPIGDDRLVWDVRGVFSSLAWSGAGYGLITLGDSDGDTHSELWFLNTNDLGDLQGDPLQLMPGSGTYTWWSGIASSGEEYGLFWVGPSTDPNQPPGFAVYFARAEAAGTLVEPPMTFGAGSSGISYPRPVWNGDGYGVTFSTTLPNGSGEDAFLYRIGCNCSDGDADGVSNCWDCDDADDRVYPHAAQLCDGINNDCDDPAWPTAPLDEADGDEDDFAICEGDCDDSRAWVHPSALEVCDDLDDDCDGLTDEDPDGEDSDLDGVHNACDDCPAAFDPDQLDGDGDGTGDACDTCPGISDPDQEDGDRVGDLCDNCPALPNSSQADMDGDATGDHCDLDDGMIYVVFHQAVRVEWQNEAGFDAWNCYGGDLGILQSEGLYTQEPGSNDLAHRACGVTETWMADTDPAAGRIAFFLTTGILEGSTTESVLGLDGSGAVRPNDHPCE